MYRLRWYLYGDHSYPSTKTNCSCLRFNSSLELIHLSEHRFICRLGTGPIELVAQAYRSRADLLLRNG